MMAEMGMTMDMPWTAADVFFTFAMWAVMMVGMMTRTAAPVLLLFAGAQCRARDAAPGVAVSLFGARLPARLGRLQRRRGARAVGAAPGRDAVADDGGVEPAWRGAILIAAGVYQLTPFKGACLTHCRSPLGFLMTQLARRHARARSGWGSRTAPIASAAAGR